MNRLWSVIALAIVTLAALSGLLWAIASTVTQVACGTAPTGGAVFSGIAFTVTGDPSQLGDLPVDCEVPTTIVWVLDGVALLLLLAAITTVTVLIRRILHSDLAFRVELLFRDGFARRPEIRKTVSAKAVLARSGSVRPTLKNPTVDQVGWKLGRARGVDVHASIEDSLAVFGPPRMGKGYRLIIGAILDWSGPLITTSTRGDNLAATLKARASRGKTIVVDPQRLSGVESAIVPSPSQQCEDPETAARRARQIIAGTALGKSGSNQEWAGESATILSRLLHAAAISGAGTDALARWGSGPGMARRAVEILKSDGAPGWGDSLRETLDGDPEMLANKWLGVSAAVEPLNIPTIRDAFTPDRGRRPFDPDEFLASSNTLYLIGTGADAASAGGFLSAVLDDTVAVARRRALASPGNRLDPPLGLVLDEIANMFTWPELVRLLADGGGLNISVLVVLQGLAQARSVWSDAEAVTIWNSAIAKVMLGGASDTTFLQDIATLLGPRKVQAKSNSYTEESTSTSVHKQDAPVMSVADLRRLPDGMGLLTYRNRRGILLDTLPWTDRADADQIKAQKKQTESEQLAVFQRLEEERRTTRV